MPTRPFSSFHDEARDRADIAEESRDEFDRIAFAMSALDHVLPRRMTVAVCRGRSRLRVESGRAWGRGEGARWAMVSIPPRASRKAIVLALMGLRGAPEEPGPSPYILDVLLSGAGETG